MSVSAVPSSPVLVALDGGCSASVSAMKLGLRAPSPASRPSQSSRHEAPRVDEFAGLDRLDREELDEDYVTPSRQRVA